MRSTYTFNSFPMIDNLKKERKREKIETYSNKFKSYL